MAPSDAGVGTLYAPGRVPACVRRAGPLPTAVAAGFLTVVAAADEDACFVTDVAGVVAVGDGSAAGAAAACAGACWVRLDDVSRRRPARAPMTSAIRTTAASRYVPRRPGLDSARRIWTTSRATDPSGRKSSKSSSTRNESRLLFSAKRGSARFAEVAGITILVKEDAQPIAWPACAQWRHAVASGKLCRFSARFHTLFIPRAVPRQGRSTWLGAPEDSSPSPRRRRAAPTRRRTSSGRAL